MAGVMMERIESDCEDRELEPYIAELCENVRQLSELPQMDLSSATSAQTASELIQMQLLRIAQQRRIARGLLQLARRTVSGGDGSRTGGALDLEQVIS